MELCLISILISVLIIIFTCSGVGFLNVLFKNETDIEEHKFIEIYKLDADRFRFLPRIIFKFFIFFIEYSYKIGIFLGECLKFMFIKDTKR